MSIILTIITTIYAVIGFFVHQECIRLKKEDDDALWEGLDKNAWWVEMVFLLCALFWPCILIVAILRKEG